MKQKDILPLRLMSQQLAQHQFKTPADLVSWMGALQAQDYNMAKWAIGLRLPNITEEIVNKAFDKGQLIRTHVLRPTWHIIAADDIHWLLELSAAKILQKMKTRDKQLELTPAIFKKSNQLIEKLLNKTKHATRKEIVAELEKAKIRLDDSRASHLLGYAELNGLICSGPHREKETTYTLLHNWVPNKKSLHREEAIAKLAATYFQSHGPATLADFCWWAGLNLTEGKKGIEAIKKDFVVEDDLIIPDVKLPASKAAAYLIPAFDEFIISYKDRSTILDSAHHAKAFTSNGIFWPTLLVKNKIAGLWKRSIIKDKLVVETDYFHKPATSHRSLINKAANDLGHFLNRTPQLVHS